MFRALSEAAPRSMQGEGLGEGAHKRTGHYQGRVPPFRAQLAPSGLDIHPSRGIIDLLKALHWLH